MTNEQKTAKAQEAFNTLIEIGSDSFIDPNKTSIGDKLAMGLSKATSNCQDIIEAAASHCEDWNYHSEARLLRLIASGYFKISEENKNRIILEIWEGETLY